jgi:hypothetical protein
LYILYSVRMLLALLYVLGSYLFVSLLLYSMHIESPPERVDEGEQHKDSLTHTLKLHDNTERTQG